MSAEKQARRASEDESADDKDSSLALRAGVDGVRLHRPRIGLVAGWGRFPIVLAESLRRRGYDVCCLGIKNHADAVLAQICDDFAWVGLSKLGRAIRHFRRHDIREATLAGKIHKVRLYRPGAWLEYWPDWRTLRTFWPHFIARRKDRRDDTLLSAAVGAFTSCGIAIAAATQLAPELLVKSGQLTRRGPSSAQWRDIELGWRLAKELGRLDIGQSVAVKDRTPLAVEAIEGTDQCIRRAGELCPAGGFTVVKVAKPQQDMRFDVPTIGVGTLESMAAAGGSLLAVEAGRTIVVDEPQVIEFAERHRIVVVAVNSEEIDERHS